MTKTVPKVISHTPNICIHPRVLPPITVIAMNGDNVIIQPISLYVSICFSWFKCILKLNKGQYKSERQSEFFIREQFFFKSFKLRKFSLS